MLRRFSLRNANFARPSRMTAKIVHPTLRLIRWARGRGHGRPLALGNDAKLKRLKQELDLSTSVPWGALWG